MENRKIIAREVAPELVDFSGYFDDDGLTEKGGDFCYSLFIVGNDRSKGFNSEIYECIQSDIDALGEIDGDQWGDLDGMLSWRTAELIDNDAKKIEAIKEYAPWGDKYDIDSVSQFLTIITGKEWDTKYAYGYYQGDCAQVVYCVEHYQKEHICEIAKFWLGCGTEFEIDGLYGFYVTDDIRWKEDGELMVTLAEAYGCDPDDLEIYLYDGEVKTAKYRLMESA